MRISDFDLERRVFVVAEIGNNHEGDAAVAHELIERAAAAGADAVKFQTFRTEHYVGPDDVKRFARLRSFELPYGVFAELARLAHDRGVLFLSTPFDLGSADFLAPHVDAFKIASGDIDFLPLLRRVAATGKPVILSTGQSRLEDVERAVGVLQDRGARSEIAILHCVSSYPAPEADVNLRALGVLAERFPDCAIGYSDHTVGLDASPLAVACGARVIEKHFTLDHDFSDFRDHQLSVEPDEMRELVRRIRLAETLLGAARKDIQPSEEGVALTLRRSIAAARDLPAGHLLAEADLTWVRPADGLRPGEEGLLLDHVLARAVRAGERLREADLES